MGPKVVVTGGSGYVGGRVASALAERGFQVVAFDVAEPPSEGDSGVDFVRGDILDLPALRRAFEGAEAVVHTAGYGLSGADNLAAHSDVTRSINVDGTRNVVEACSSTDSVRALVFTSTVNIRFTGEELLDASEEDHEEEEEDLTYLDEYSRTKHEAERIVLSANGENLKTCSLRLGGVYGPGERSMFPRSIRFMRSGLMDVAYCVPDHLRIDFLHIDNAVQAHLRALDKMLEERPDERVSGQVFYITDGRPQSLSSFLSPLHRSLRGGRPISPLIRIPPAATVAFAKAYQASSGILSRIRRRGRDRAPPTMPFWGLTPMEAYKITVSHHFSIAKARRDLGYDPSLAPEEEVWREILDSYGLEWRPPREEEERRPSRSGRNSALTRISSWIVFFFVFAVALKQSDKHSETG